MIDGENLLAVLPRRGLRKRNRGRRKDA
jgi:hypothetical protein